MALSRPLSRLQDAPEARFSISGQPEAGSPLLQAPPPVPAMIPRALRSPVMAMARPRRPAAEVRAVCAAAAAIRAETGMTSARALGREIAERVTAAMLDDAKNDPAAIFPSFAGDDPIAVLAFGHDIGAVAELAERFRDRTLAAFGTFIPPIFQQEVQRRDAARELRATLAERYTRHLRLSPVR